MRRAALALAALASACSLGSPPAPTLESVTPNRTQAGTATAVLIRGSGFEPRVVADLDQPASSGAGAPFALTLVRAAQRLPLEAAVVVSDDELAARVPPIGTPATYDLELVDPRGRTVVLPAAFTVDPATCGPNGAPCDDDDVCTRGDACLNGACVPGAPVCGNTAPRACLTVTPRAAVPGAAITLDASCSSDGESPASALQARFHLDGPLAWDTGFAPVANVQTLAPAGVGLLVATVEVVDPGGLSDFASRYVLVTPAGDQVVVTTAADEANPGDGPVAPAGSGLSLREAIAWVNGLGAPRTIVVPLGAEIVHGSALPALAVTGAAIVVSDAAPLRFPGVTLPCVTLASPDQLLLGATVTGCAKLSVELGNGSDRAQVAECTVAPAAGGHGIEGKASGKIGPRDTITGAVKAIKLSGASYSVEESDVRANDTGISVVAGVELRVVRSRISASGGDGLAVAPSAATITLLHDVFDANGSDGVSLPSSGGAVVAQNNLFTRNGGFGIRGGATATGTRDHNGFFANALGPLSAGNPGSTDLVADPRYAGGHRLAPGSPAIDRGVPVTVDVNGVPGVLDVNGPAAGQWSGAASDLGAWESPYTPAP